MIANIRKWLKRCQVKRRLVRRIEALGLDPNVSTQPALAELLSAAIEYESAGVSYVVKGKRGETSFEWIENPDCQCYQCYGGCATLLINEVRANQVWISVS